MSLLILHISQSVNPKHGGPIEGIRQQAQEHARYGHHVEICSLDRPNSPFLSFPGVKVYPLHISLLDKFFPLTLYKWLIKHSYKYDAIVINGIWGFHMLSCWLALRKATTPYFVFTHGMLDPWFRKTFPLKHLKKWLLWPWAIYPVLRDAHGVFFTCQQEMVLARESFWLYDCNEIVINYGTQGNPNPNLNLADSFLSKHSCLKYKNIFLFLGRVHPKKGPDLLVRAVHDLQVEGIWNPDNNIVLMAGPADSTFGHRLVSLAEKLGVSESFYWSGMVSGMDKWGAFQAADVFILPSHQENFGIAVAEALSCSCPVLLSTEVNISPEIESYQAGFVDSDTLDGTKRLIRRWLELEPEKKDKMRHAARSCFSTRFHISNTSKAITQTIYLALLEKLASTVKEH